MFNKFKQLKQLKDFESSLKKQTIIKEKDGIKIVLNLKMDILEIKLNQELSFEEQEKKLKDCLNEAMNDAKLQMAKQAQSMGGFGL
ncbi:MAG: YbaB/EbfC family nucleoid-associated protein [Candidatus Paceibacterota bacterium]